LRRIPRGLDEGLEGVAAEQPGVDAFVAGVGDRGIRIVTLAVEERGQAPGDRVDVEVAVGVGHTKRVRAEPGVAEAVAILVALDLDLHVPVLLEVDVGADAVGVGGGRRGRSGAVGVVHHVPVGIVGDDPELQGGVDGAVTLPAHVAHGRALLVGAVAVLVDAVFADFLGAGVRGGLRVVAVTGAGAVAVTVGVIEVERRVGVVAVTGVVVAVTVGIDRDRAGVRGGVGRVAGGVTPGVDRGVRGVVRGGRVVGGAFAPGFDALVGVVADEHRAVALLAQADAGAVAPGNLTNDGVVVQAEIGAVRGFDVTDRRAHISEDRAAGGGDGGEAQQGQEERGAHCALLVLVIGAQCAPSLYGARIPC